MFNPSMLERSLSFLFSSGSIFKWMIVHAQEFTFRLTEQWLVACNKIE